MAEVPTEHRSLELEGVILDEATNASPKAQSTIEALRALEAFILRDLITHSELLDIIQERIAKFLQKERFDTERNSKDVEAFDRRLMFPPLNKQGRQTMNGRHGKKMRTVQQVHTNGAMRQSS